MDNRIEKDKSILIELGGATKVARLLEFNLERGGAQRVQNWYKRGIPPQVKIDNPELFLNK